MSWPSHSMPPPLEPPKRGIKAMPPTSVAQQQFAASQALAMSPVMPPPPPEAHAVQPNLPTNPRKRRASGQPSALAPPPALGQGPIMPAQLQVGAVAVPPFGDLVPSHEGVQTAVGLEQPPATPQPPAKKGRTNIPWTPTEEQRLKQMRDQGKSWSEIAKTFPNRTEGSVKKHWYKDMHYAEFDAEEAAALLAAMKEYESNKWKFIGGKLNKPAKACEQYAKQHFAASK